MPRRDQRVKLIVNHGKQLGRTLLLLAHYTTQFGEFVGRFVQGILAAMKWTNLFARTTASVFDFIYQHLHRGRRRTVGTKEICLDR